MFNVTILIPCARPRVASVYHTDRMSPAAPIQPYKQEFLELAIALGVLRFGQFTLKSGRVSPYFFNAGLFNTGSALAKLGRFYAQAIIDSAVAYDMVFGPAYKGIPLAAATAVALAEQHGMDVPFAFNRKEAKAHGEGGAVVGAALTGRVLILDDVITAGTAIRQSIEIIESAGAQPAAVVIALDRQERGTGALSAVQEVEQGLSLPVISLVVLDDLIELLKTKKDQKVRFDELEDYRRRYGV